MSAEACPSDAASRQELASFLLAASGVQSAVPLLAWKYDVPRTDFAGPRSYVLRDTGGAIVAHAGLCPATFSLPSGDVRASYVIDWAGNAREELIEEIAPKFDMLVAVGGAPETQTALPRLGYRRAGEMQVFTRVLRPFAGGWKSPLRLARNVIASRAAAPPIPEGWSAQPITAFDLSCQPLFEDRVHSPFPSTRRTPGLMNYWLACPGASAAAALVRQNGELRGWFIMTRVGPQARIADLWVNSNSVGDWLVALSMAIDAAMKDAAVSELVLSASIPMAIEAAPLAGFRAHEAEPIFAFDPKNALGALAMLNVAPVESDLAYSAAAHASLT
jgi:hypothetical protein